MGPISWAGLPGTVFRPVHLHKKRENVVPGGSKDGGAGKPFKLSLSKEGVLSLSTPKTTTNLKLSFPCVFLYFYYIYITYIYIINPIYYILL